MRTTRPVSTIWFGSKAFLVMQLDEMIRKNEITFYAAVQHFAEEDEKKDHIHLYIVPDGQLDTSHLTDILTEFDLTNEKPIKPLPYNFSKFGDWYLYVSHNVTYLLSKGQTRKYHYSLDDFFSSSDDALIEMVHTIDLSKINQVDKIKRAAESGVTFAQLVKDGQIPVQLIKQYQEVYQIIANGYVEEHTRRGVYMPHEEPQDDKD